jgi:iron(III) transport system ATP-binding protein
VGSVNVFAGAAREDAGRWMFDSPALGSAALPAGVRPPSPGHDLAFRPHAVRLQPAPGAMPDTEFAMAGRIESFEFLGEFVRYEVRVGTALVTADIHHARDLVPFARDTPVVLGIPGPEIRFIGN